jgi:glycosyltransferase involved in cell wall biosynthesis
MSGGSILFLRGQVPRDRDPRQIMFDSLDECDDVWTQLAARMALGGRGEVWYWGGRREVEYRDGFVERWLPDLGDAGRDFDPDIIFARGGFREYDAVLRRHPRAFKVYYGAGLRFVPTGFTGYDLILVDSPEQLAAAKDRLPGVASSMLIKPAAENVFRPRPGPKDYDVIFVGNEMGTGRKGHGFVLPGLPAGLRMVQVGIASKEMRAAYPRVLFTGWIPRRDIPELYGRAKAAICCCAAAYDSCPRVIPEALACGCPILVLDGVRLWKDKYITGETGLVAPRGSFFERLSWLVENHRRFSPYEYYRENLSLDVAARHILGLCGRA